MKRKYVFDGQIYAQRITGIYRYADEILMELDKIINKNEYEIIVPEYVDLPHKFNNFKVIHYGKVKGIMWSQTSLVAYLLKHNAICVGFYNTTPLLRHGIAVIHDIGYKVLKNHYKNLYGRCSALWHRLNYFVISNSKQPIITVSEFSKKQLCEIYHVASERVTVIGNGWQHFERIIEDEKVFKDFNIQRYSYYFALGSLEERKNFRWIVEVAKRNPEKQFVIAGGAVKNAKEKINFDEIPNVLFVGYISDKYVKALMRYCKAFLFPSLFEGFGIPPLEAMSLGVNVICSNAASLPEICGDAVQYVNVDEYDFNLDEIIEHDCYQYKSVLNRYSWEQSASKFLEVIRKNERGC